jgi:hypothetical protein
MSTLFMHMSITREQCCNPIYRAVNVNLYSKFDTPVNLKKKGARSARTRLAARTHSLYNKKSRSGGGPPTDKYLPQSAFPCHCF